LKRAGAVDAFMLSRRYRLAPLVPGDREALRDGQWSVELAWDGHRVLLALAAKRLRMVSADFREWSDTFPTLAHALGKLAAREAVVDGFLYATDERGRPSFELLRESARTRKTASFAAWDLLHLDGEDLRTLPLAERRARLREVVAGCGKLVSVSEPIEGDLDAVIGATRQHGVPGVFARPVDGTYPGHDDAPWLALVHEDAELSWVRSLSPPPLVTNEAKVLYPRDGFTKKDVVAYYDGIAQIMLPHLADRPVVAQRWPDGIDDFTWYQHRIPPRAPDYLRGVWIEGNHRIVLPNKDALTWMANQAAITVHGWASRVGRLAEPDWVVLDLDPDESTPWAVVIEVAVAVRKLLELLELPSVPKTSGQRGLHVLVPLAPGHDPTRAHDFARKVSLLIARLLPDKVTLELEREKRGGRLYLDHVQGYVGKSLVMAYALRAVDGAPVSAPLDWSEVTPALDPKAFNLRTMRARLDAKGDLAATLLGGGVRLDAAMATLAQSGV